MGLPATYALGRRLLSLFLCLFGCLLACLLAFCLPSLLSGPAPFFATPRGFQAHFSCLCFANAVRVRVNEGVGEQVSAEYHMRGIAYQEQSGA
jgi:hypothetical protein